MGEPRGNDYFDDLLAQAEAENTIDAGLRRRLSEAWRPWLRRRILLDMGTAVLGIGVIGSLIALVLAAAWLWRNGMLAPLQAAWDLLHPAAEQAAGWFGRLGAGLEESVKGMGKFLGDAAVPIEQFVSRRFGQLGNFLFRTLPLPARAALAFGLVLLSNLAEPLFAQRRFWRRLIRPAHIAGAVLFVWLIGHVIRHCVIAFHWGGLEVASLGLWGVLPLLPAVLETRRPLAMELFAAIMAAIHVGVFCLGLSGNGIIALDGCLAVILINGAPLFADRHPATAARIRWLSMAVVGFLLYCSGFVRDLPAILEFRSFLQPGAAAAVALAWVRGRRGDGRERACLALLSLATLAFAHLATGLLLGTLSIGEVYDLSGERYRLSHFTSNTLAVVALAWILWFLWCLWTLAESRMTRQPLLAQIGVTAMLCSFETRYIELVRNFSLAAGLFILPPALLLIAGAGRILGGWLEELEGDDAASPGDGTMTTDMTEGE